MKFTDAQKEAIHYFQGPCLVLAVPGAGKTTVLLYRLMALLDQGVPAKNIGSLTFSRQQAQDMAARFHKLRGPLAGLTFSTIHAFCYQVVRTWARKHGLAIRVLSGSGPEKPGQIIRQLYTSYSRRPLADEDLESFFRISGYLKNTLTSYKAYVKKTGDRFPHFEDLDRDYQAYKSKRGLVDFDDMLVLSLRIFQEDPAILKGLQNRFRFLQVDEAQDTSLLQLRIIQEIVKPENNLFMVADDDQAIYSFRGASPSYLLRFKDLYPSGKIITMEDNYRSSKRIVKAAGSFIQHNQARFDKRPWTDQEDENKIRIIITPNLEKELDSLVKETAKDLDYGSLAILFRNNISMPALADRLDRAGIPFHTQSRSDRFFNHPVLQDLLTILRFAHDPMDLESFWKIYYKLNAYIKRSFMEEISQMDGQVPVLDRLRNLSGTQNYFYQEILDRLEGQFRIIREQNMSQAIGQISDYLGYGDYLKEKSRREGRPLAYSLRIVETVQAIAKHTPSPAAFSQRLHDLKKVIDRASKNRKAPCFLSTVHGAKGLEFDSVSVIDLIQNEFPSAPALEAKKNGKNFLMEEERRLFYVAITRTRSRLKLYGRRKVNGKKVEVSQFLKELRG